MPYQKKGMNSPYSIPLFHWSQPPAKNQPTCQWGNSHQTTVPYVLLQYRPCSYVSSHFIDGQAFLNIPMMPDADLVYMCRTTV
jgi:hypothetical protein